IPRLKPRKTRKRSKEVVVETSALHKSFGGGRSFLGFGRRTRTVDAVIDVNIELRKGETLGVVGESGSGKSTLARCIIRLIDSDNGMVELNGVDITTLKRNEMRQHRKFIQMVFQDPFASLNPRSKVGDIISQGPMLQGIEKAKAHQRTRELLDVVGLDSKAFNRFPHEFSGGQRQRICIARALAVEPEFIICDESVSALDVSVQAQVLNLLNDLQESRGLTYIFISHDLSVVKFMADMMAVMKEGHIVEYGPSEAIYRNPKEEYTRSLIEATPCDDLENIRRLVEHRKQLRST
ncbi:MAG TPA: microcin ABC transporter ATP-binding protein, partial [Planctomycetaceae bacterium]|nr:microcin ABC transporter ATP-binding protein [Planctomycetaceae bacterium]